MADNRQNRAAAFAGKRPPIDYKSIKRILSYLKRYTFGLIIVALCIIISASSGVLGSLFIQRLIDGFIKPLLLTANPDFTELFTVLSIMAGIYLVGVICTWLYNFIMVHIVQGTLQRIRNNLFSKMQKLPIRYFDEHSFGDIMSRFTNDTDTLEQLLGQSLPQMFSSVMTIIAVFTAMLYLSVWLAIFVVVFVFLMLLFVKKLGKKSSKYFKEQQRTLGALNGFIEEMINGQKVIKVFCHEEIAKTEFDQKNEELFENMFKANRFANILMPIMANLGHLQYALIAILGSMMALTGVVNVGLTGVTPLTLGSISSFLLLSKSFSMPINQVSQQINSIIMALAGAGRIFELMDEIPEEDDGRVTLIKLGNGKWAWKDGLKRIPLKGDVKINNVTFSYNSEKEVLHDVSIYAKPGQKIAFVGHTGAGKTTITNLLNRFYDIDSGEILYDGIDIKRIKKEDLRLSIGMVLQDVNMFTGTIMDNIRYGRLDATDEECIAAAKLANADTFIRNLPNGYKTIINGAGGSLSQGQLQLLSIARAAVADPPVMILDEATSSIDTRTEAIISEGMDKLMENRTVFVIAHRLSTVQNAKAIMVLENGKIIERGNHEDLIAQKGKYYELYTGKTELE